MISLFDKDTWQEAYYTITLQKWRSLMTMFGVFWGLFMLVVLLGCGFGMNNGMMGVALSMATNSIFVVPDVTNIPYNGLDRDRKWTITVDDIHDIEKESGGRLDYITTVGLDYEQLVSRGDQTAYPTVGGISPSYLKTVPQKVIAGRYINAIDVARKRKVCVIGQTVARELFGDEEACGQHITVADMDYLVVGVVKQTNNQINVGLPATTSVLLPITTELAAFDHGGDCTLIAVTYKEAYDIKDYTDAIVSLLMKNHSIHPADKSAVMTFNMKEGLKGYAGLDVGVHILLWIVGIGTLLAGLIGISNIMIVTIKERTQEIGVRRALGAEPKVIIRQIMIESLMLTLTAGVAGIVTGAWLLAGISRQLPPPEEGVRMIVNPMVPLPAALTALVILVVSGLAAGFFPARRAMKIKAIEALREE